MSSLTNHVPCYSDLGLHSCVLDTGHKGDHQCVCSKEVTWKDESVSSK